MEKKKGFFERLFETPQPQPRRDKKKRAKAERDRRLAREAEEEDLMEDLDEYN